MATNRIASPLVIRPSTPQAIASRSRRSTGPSWSLSAICASPNIIPPVNWNCHAFARFSDPTARSRTNTANTVASHGVTSARRMISRDNAETAPSAKNVGSRYGR